MDFLTDFVEGARDFRVVGDPSLLNMRDCIVCCLHVFKTIFSSFHHLRKKFDVKQTQVSSNWFKMHPLTHNTWAPTEHTMFKRTCNRL